jgi:RNA polymerase sigma-70 factor, ECF subfamily
VTEADEAVERAFRAEWPRIVATLIGAYGDWDLAEECVQDAFAKALERWSIEGVPDNPGAWLTTTARHRAIDVLRRRTAGVAKLQEAAVLHGDEASHPDRSGIPDDRLRLIFTCCHPALALDAQIALTLRTLVGLTTEEIARAMLVPTATMTKRLTRAKRKIAEAGIPFCVPERHVIVERTSAMLGVLYLLFNEGYSATKGDAVVRQDLADEAIRLAGLLCETMPDESETWGLCALMVLQHSRRDARLDEAAELVILEDQDRSQWRADEIAEGHALLERAARLHHRGPYQMQAAIAWEHCRARSATDTDWQRIDALYVELLELSSSPVVELNRAVALAKAVGPAAGLAAVDAMAERGELGGYFLFHATRAELCRQLGRTDEAARAYDRALELVGTTPERRHLERRRAALASGAEEWDATRNT